MFGALNRFISRLDSDSPAQSASGHGLFGFQVLRNTDAGLPIEPWFDFVVGINGRQIVRLLRAVLAALTAGAQDDPDPHLFAQEVRNCAGGTVTLGLWTAKVTMISDASALSPLRSTRASARALCPLPSPRTRRRSA